MSKPTERKRVSREGFPTDEPSIEDTVGHTTPEPSKTHANNISTLRGVCTSHAV